jgi:hypothetical protein
MAAVATVPHQDKADGPVKSPKAGFSVIPAEAGIQLIQVVLDSRFRWSDGFSGFLRDHQKSIVDISIIFV